MKTENLAVCLPYCKGITIYIQNAGQDLRRLWHDDLDDCTLHKLTEVLHPPRLVIFVGIPCANEMGVLLLQQTNLCIIPDQWLEHIPPWNRVERAEFSIKLLEAHLNYPIRLFGAIDNREDTR